MSVKEIIPEKINELKLKADQKADQLIEETPKNDDIEVIKEVNYGYNTRSKYNDNYNYNDNYYYYGNNRNRNYSHNNYRKTHDKKYK